MVDYDTMLQQLNNKIYAFSHGTSDDRSPDVTYNLCCYVLVPVMILSLLYINKPAIIMKTDTTEPNQEIDTTRLICVTFVASVGIRVSLFYTVG